MWQNARAMESAATKRELLDEREQLSLRLIRFTRCHILRGLQHRILNLGGPASRPHWRGRGIVL
jgi:hypothetical protein